MCSFFFCFIHYFLSQPEDLGYSIESWEVFGRFCVLFCFFNLSFLSFLQVIEIVLNFLYMVYVSECVNMTLISKDHTNVSHCQCSFFPCVRQEEEQFFSLVFVFTLLHDHAVQSLCDVDDPLFPPAHHLLLIYAA